MFIQSLEQQSETLASALCMLYKKSVLSVYDNI